MPLSEYFSAIRDQVEKTLEKLVPPADTYPQNLHEAMRYSLFAGGKRLRPMLAIAACDAVGGETTPVEPYAAALEIIHTYTLIHDDLPALDNDELRRGKPTNHIKFGESTAIMAGDGLLTLAFEIMTDLKLYDGVAARTVLAVASETALAVGSKGTIGGQVVDLQMEKAEPDAAALEYIHTHKTGKLIVASIRGGAMLGGANSEQLEALTEYGKLVGLAFQVVDDILDVEGNEKLLGKEVGADSAKGKMTYPSIMGLEESKKFAEKLIDNAVDSIKMFGVAGAHLAELARYINSRVF